MNKLIGLLILVTILSCSDKKESKKEIINTTIEKTESKNKETKPKSVTQRIELTDFEKEIANVALSFHRWYIKNTNELNSDIPTDFDVTEGKNDNCIVNYEPYFNELRKLGTISNSFMDKEKERTRLCAETIANMNWSEYIGVIPENCDDYLYWTNSQDITDGVDVVGINNENDNWTVFLSLYMLDKNGKKYFGNDKLKVTVINENEKYLIQEINWIMK